METNLEVITSHLCLADGGLPGKSYYVQRQKTKARVQGAEEGLLRVPAGSMMILWLCYAEGGGVLFIYRI